MVVDTLMHRSPAFKVSAHQTCLPFKTGASYLQRTGSDSLRKWDKTGAWICMYSDPIPCIQTYGAGDKAINDIRTDQLLSPPIRKRRKKYLYYHYKHPWMHSRPWNSEYRIEWKLELCYFLTWINFFFILIYHLIHLDCTMHVSC